MNPQFQEYEARKIVNVRQHVDGPWFWNRYSAFPYVGCSSGCEFCYYRGDRYLGHNDPDKFDMLIRVKTNAVELLREELSNLKPDLVTCGDWQQEAEERYELSRQMLVVLLELKFPLFIVERSPLLTRDLDLLAEFKRNSWVGVNISISNLDPELKQAFEPNSPGLDRRLHVMEILAKMGIPVGTALRPVIPFLGDDRAHLEEVVRATKDRGGSWVVYGSLTMDSAQAERTLAAVKHFDPGSETQFRQTYNWEQGGMPNYDPSRAYHLRVSSLVRELCAKHGVSYHIPRYIPPGPLAVNKRVAEKLFLKIDEMEMAQIQDSSIWAYRWAAWTVDELNRSVAEVYQNHGLSGLEELPAVGTKMAKMIAGWLGDMHLDD